MALFPFPKNSIAQESVLSLTETLDSKAVTNTNAEFDTVRCTRMQTVQELNDWKDSYGVPDGTRAFATDCDANQFGELAYGGGSYGLPVYLMGGQWRIG